MLSKIDNLLRETLQRLLIAGIDTSLYEIKLLLASAMETDITQLKYFSNFPTESQQYKFQKMIELRLNNMPVDKILGVRGFYKYEFKINTDVLSPRPDTEILVEEAIRVIKDKKISNVLELGVGSGCIILSLLADILWLSGCGVDISLPALAIAKENARRLKVDNRVIFKQGDWFSSDFFKLFDKKFDLLVSNPPYISSNEILTLAPEVKNYDPLWALDGGDDGLSSYRQIAKIAPLLLNNDGIIILEIGEGQTNDVIKIFAKNGFVCESVLNDLSDIQRCICLKKISCI